MPALWTDDFEFVTAFAAEFSLFTILKLAFWAFHCYALLFDVSRLNNCGGIPSG
jgi:hypothetical protein